MPTRLHCLGMGLQRIVAGMACLALAVLLRHWLEAQMLRHMLLQLPLITAAGYLLAGPTPCMQHAAKFDEHGICGLTALLFVSAYWMIPRALELSLGDASVQTAKFTSLLLLGALLPGSFQRAGIIVQLFFLGNFCWMMAIVGIQYQNLPQRLCNAYLLDDQSITGAALVTAAIAIALVWCLRQAPILFSTSQKTHIHVPPGTDSRLDLDPGPRLL